MGKKRRIVLRTRTFEKHGDGTLFFRNMLNRYKIGDIVDTEDSVDLTSLLERHEEVSEKVGVGVHHFEVAGAPDEYGGQCFWIVRTNGTRIDFSYKHCLEARPYDN